MWEVWADAGNTHFMIGAEKGAIGSGVAAAYCSGVTLPAIAKPPTNRTELILFIAKYEKSLL